jgi:hypothetical protein
MKRFALFRTFVTATIITVAFALAALLPVPQPASAATPNVAVGAGSVVVIPFHVSGQYTATTNNVIKFAMPFPCRLLGVGAIARASGGTSPTLTVDLLNGGTSVLSSAISITAGTYSEGTISTATVADEAVMSVNLTIGGTSPTWNDITILITAVRR